MQLVERTVAMLRALGARPEGLALGELASVIGAPPPSAHRLLATLVDQGMALRHPDKRYTLGPEALALARAARSLEDYAVKAIRELATRLDQTAFVARWTGSRVICTSMCTGRRALRLFVEEGEDLPIHAAASARIIAAYQPRESIGKILNNVAMEAFTPKTPITIDRVFELLDANRTRGYDVSYDELDHRVLAVSAPIRRESDEVTASISVAGPVLEGELSEKIEVWVREVLQLAGELSVRSTAGDN